jgi:hypothetical protein
MAPAAFMLVGEGRKAAEKLTKLKMVVLPATFGRHIFCRVDFEAIDFHQA